MRWTTKGETASAPPAMWESKAIDMLTLSLADFICSDFNSTVDNHEYPTRNCSAVDEKWAAAPTDEKWADAPCSACCTNNKLAFQSLLLTALNQTGSGESLKDSLNNRTLREQLFKDWAEKQINCSARGLSRQAHGGG